MPGIIFITEAHMPFWDHELLLVEKVCRNIHVADPDDHFTKEVMQRAANADGEPYRNAEKGILPQIRAKSSVFTIGGKLGEKLHKEY